MRPPRTQLPVGKPRRVTANSSAGLPRPFPSIVPNLLGISLACCKRRSQQGSVSFCSSSSSLNGRRGRSSKRRIAMIYKKLAALSAAIVVGVALITAPAQARMGGFGGGGFGGGFHGGGGFAGARVGSFGGFRAGGFGGGFARTSAFLGRPGFIGRPGFFPGRRFAFFHGRRFGAPFFGVGAFAAASFSSCWTWVPTTFGWQRVWACDSSWGGWDGGYGGY
jgi:hypothetical protein